MIYLKIFWIGAKQQLLTHSLSQVLLTGEGQIVHLSGADDNNKADNALPGNCFTISGVDCDKACVKKEDCWNVVEDSLAKKNNEKDKKFRYVFHNNCIILYLR